MLEKLHKDKQRREGLERLKNKAQEEAQLNVEKAKLKWKQHHVLALSISNNEEQDRFIVPSFKIDTTIETTRVQS